MARCSDLVNIGINEILSDFLGDSFDLEIVALGNASQANAYPLTKTINKIITCTLTDNSVRMPVVADYKNSFLAVSNSGASPLNVYPAAGRSFLGVATDTPLVLTNSQGLVCFRTSLYTWFAIRNVIA